jgi:hypothetical protein
MYSLLIKAMFLTVLFQLGLSFSDFSDCRSRQCFRKIDAAVHKVLDIDWKPISVFPEEAKRFR